MENDIVITTKSILAGKSKIFEIYHEDDGTWQALPYEEFMENDSKVISIKNLLELDISIKDLLSLDTGYKAIKINNKWIISKDNS